MAARLSVHILWQHRLQLANGAQVHKYSWQKVGLNVALTQMKTHEGLLYWILAPANIQSTTTTL